MIKIMDQIIIILTEDLTKDMNQANLKEYLKNNFLRRKLKLS